MSNYSSNLKSWGASGSEYPDGYNYTAGEQPVDEWDNFIQTNVINDLFHLIDLTDDRLESKSGSSHPSSPEPGHISHRTDGVVTSDEELFFYDSTNSVWNRLLKADGDTMSGVLDMAGYGIKDSNGTLTFSSDSEVSGSLDVSGPLTHEGVDPRYDLFRNHDGGTVSDGTLVPVGTFSLADTETLEITQASFTKDGFTSPAVSGVDLIIASENDSAESDTVKVLTGDGSTLYNDETGTPLASYQNTSGAAESVVVAIDNGHFNAGSGSPSDIMASYIARKV